MPENKTKATALSPATYVAAIADDGRRADCEQLLALMARATGQPALMWGTAIVGFGLHRYPLAGGKQGEICAVGFSSRKSDIVLYGLDPETRDARLMATLGKHKLGKGCVYVKHLADVDAQVLQQLVEQGFRGKHAG
jgi:hypothetical protein